MSDPKESAVTSLRRLCGLSGRGGSPTVMLVLAHPDDECVGVASLLPALRLATFAYLTDGAPRDSRDAEAVGCASRQAYAALRRGEVRSALDSVGVPAGRIEFIDCTDQEASAHLVPLVRWIEILIREHQPELVLTHPYEGGHPDHDAAAFVVQTAARRIAVSGEPPPALAEFTSYHVRDGAWSFGRFLPAEDAAEIVRTLTAHERMLKRRLLGCHASQHGVLRHVPLDVERFRPAPDYDFTLPPHPGRLLYEQMPWGITGASWRELAARALAELGLPASPARVADPLPF